MVRWKSGHDRIIAASKALLLLIVGSCFAVGLPTSAFATTYYVSLNGSDSYTGLSPSYQSDSTGPFRTITRAVNSIKAGDTVMIRGGTYHEKVSISTNGTSAKRITITNFNGETPVIDGEYTLPGGSVYDFLVSVSGSYTTISNMIIKRSSGGLLVVYGDYARAINILGLGSRESGIIAGGNYVLLDGCTMTDNGNGYGVNGQGTWGSAIATVGDYTTIQNCLAHDNRGEGLNAYSRSSNVLMQDNISYNNRAVNLYLDSTNGGIVRRNIVYASPDWNLSWARGITIGAETGTATALTIVNNLLVGNFVNFEIDGNVTSLANSTIANNTFVNAKGSVRDGYNMGVYLRNVVFTNVLFKNNIVIEESSDRTPIWVSSSHPGLELSHNCWNKSPTLAARGTGDVTGDPQLARVGSTHAGQLVADWFKILEGSPARDRGQPLSIVQEDFNKVLRGIPPDIGAFEVLDEIVPLAATATGTPSSGPAPLAVNFDGNPSGGAPPYSYHWSFGDGHSSTVKSPSHVFSSPGPYIVTFTVEDSARMTASETININVITALPLSAHSSAMPASGNAPLAVSFTGSASGGVAPYTYSWSFGDATTSSSQNPSHTYLYAGVYTAILTVADNTSATAISTLTITVSPNVPLGATAAATPTSGQAPLAVNFTGSASGGTAPYTYRWSFGDGTSSTSRNPTHTYSTAGSYLATLTVTDTTSATATSTVAINVAASVPLGATAAATPTSGQAPQAVNFTGSASGGTAPYAYRWAFGDGTSSTSRNPTHTYSTAGSYLATLTVTDGQSSKASTTIAITIRSIVRGALLEEKKNSDGPKSLKDRKFKNK